MILRNKSKFVGGLCILLSLVIISSVQAELLFYDGFEYPAGPVEPEPWDKTGSETSTFELGSLSYPGLATTGGHMLQNDPPGNPFPYSVNDTAAGVNTIFSEAGTYYITYLGRVQGEETGEDGNGGPTFHSQASRSGPYIRPLIRYQGGGQAIARMELNGTGEPSSAPFDVNVDDGDAVLYAVRVDNEGGNDQVRLVINPDLSLGEPDWDAPALEMFTNLQTHVSDNGAIAMNRGHGWDEIRIATSWQEAVAIGGPGPAPTEFTWNNDAFGDWNDKANWSPRTVPNSAAHTANFFGTITQSSTVITETAVTVNNIVFDHDQSYVVAGFGSVSLERGTTEGQPATGVSVAQGSHQFQAPVHVLSDAEINVAGTSTLTLHNAINLNGKTVTKTGDGELSIRNDISTGGGTLTVAEGTVSGGGTVGGNLNNAGGTIAPGNSPGVLTVDGNLTNSSGGTIAIEIEGNGGAGEADGHDQIQVTGSSTLAGTLDITTGAYADPTTRATRESFTLISSAGGSTGTFDTVNYNGTELTTSHQGNGLFRNVAYGDNDVSLDNLLALEGDADGDADIDITDFNVLAANFDSAGANAETNNWTTADFDSDGDVDITDFNFLAANFADSGYLAPANNQVPEPGTLILLLIGAAFVWTWQSLRRR